MTDIATASLDDLSTARSNLGDRSAAVWRDYQTAARTDAANRKGLYAAARRLDERYRLVQLEIQRRHRENDENRVAQRLRDAIA